MSNSKEVVVRSSGGLSLGMILFVVFLTLRLTDNIDWAWYWVAAPLWIPIGIGLSILTVAFVIGLIGALLGAL